MRGSSGYWHSRPRGGHCFPTRPYVCGSWNLQPPRERHRRQRRRCPRFPSVPRRAAARPRFPAQAISWQSWRHRRSGWLLAQPRFPTGRRFPIRLRRHPQPPRWPRLRCPSRLRHAPKECLRPPARRHPHLRRRPLFRCPSLPLPRHPSRLRHAPKGSPKPPARARLQRHRLQPFCLQRCRLQRHRLQRCPLQRRRGEEA